jgi:hypothetical protein
MIFDEQARDDAEQLMQKIMIYQLSFAQEELEQLQRDQASIT